jgi:hypothetical protein
MAPIEVGAYIAMLKKLDTKKCNLDSFYGKDYYRWCPIEKMPDEAQKYPVFYWIYMSTMPGLS